MNDPAPTLAGWDPARQQHVFRCLMEAFAYPGRVLALASGPGEAARLALATLVDAGVSLADPHDLLGPLDWLRLEATPVPPEQADFILCSGRIPPGFQPRLGSLENPEQSATVLVRVERLGSGQALELAGPGIQDTQELRVAGLAPEWWSRRDAWVAAFPMGIDLLLVDGERAAALPRTTRVVVQGGR
jgi:alpha-D-ribose 1-methylphosphonate 5-triphosphate synthase subunit PhnH